MQNQNASFLIGPEDASRACLLIHGFSGSPKEMLGLGEALAAHGIRVYGVELAGHSGDPDDLLRYGRKHWIASAEEGLAQLDRYPQVFVVGLSMGGVLALLLGIKHPRRIAGVVTLSTPTSFYDRWQTRAVPLLRYVMKWYYPLARLNFNDPKVQADMLQQARLRDPNAQIDFSDHNTVQAIKQMVRLPIPALAELFTLTAYCRRRLGKLITPLLIIQSHNDHTVNPRSADELFRLARAASPKSLHWLHKSDHLIVVGPEREEVFARVNHFVQTINPDDEAPARSHPVPPAEPGENSSHH
ncbi:alpha/beta hydrolase [Dictyobacter kobayashii]|uniref:Alpha/beta hydrolase n=1 Tax=Dictyobacter kobayashii TaxID=2014872 RepID=A0A402ARQ2_9CHLR|nr:alpha/beta fold hydrolase [Dictyobacter kobayashii]GCE21780.1 alpha/beta hydrolase [Dictyobacter kobayashii]